MLRWGPLTPSHRERGQTTGFPHPDARFSGVRAKAPFDKWVFSDTMGPHLIGNPHEETLNDYQIR
jgi:hypothetical protein